MELKHQIWQTWAKYLHRWGLQEIVAVFLESGSPFNFLAAQAVYLAQPLVGVILASNHLNILANMLEDETETHSFVNFLREGSQS